MNRSATAHIFNRSGFASISDLWTQQWQDIFSRLEDEQKTFLAKEADFRDPEYPWPNDSLHFWSRVWEYPYVYYHLASWRSATRSATIPLLSDLGSAVTFFPFAVARLGINVLCLDIDASCERQIANACKVVPQSPGSVSFRLISDGLLPIEDEELDAVYSISVLEHIPRFEDTIAEAARVLKPGGFFFLTIDVDTCGYMDIGIQRFYDLRRCLDDFFEFLAPERSIHPMDLYQTRSEMPYKSRDYVGWRRPWFYIKQRMLKPLVGRTPYRALPNHALWAAALRRKTPESEQQKPRTSKGLICGTGNESAREIRPRQLPNRYLSPTTMWPPGRSANNHDHPY